MVKEPIDLSVTATGAYNKMLEHIRVHRYYMGIEQQREVPYPEAVLDWYQTVSVSYTHLTLPTSDLV